jgi:hypothetical protein
LTSFAAEPAPPCATADAIVSFLLVPEPEKSEGANKKVTSDDESSNKSKDKSTSHKWIEINHRHGEKKRQKEKNQLKLYELSWRFPNFSGREFSRSCR